jgi:hypothetical protein
VIIVVKGRSNIGKSSFSRRLAAALQLTPPVWPVPADVLQLWQNNLNGWAEGAPDFLLGTGHIETDRVVGLCLCLHAAQFPPPPTWGPDVPRDDFRRWRDAAALRVLTPPLFDRFFALLCGMIESTDHTIVEGTLMGMDACDSLLARMLKFKYSRVPFIDIVLERSPYDSPDMPEGIPIVRRASVDGKAYTHDEVIAAFSRLPDGTLTVDEQLGAFRAGAIAGKAFSRVPREVVAS